MNQSKKLIKPEVARTSGKKMGRPSALTATVIAKLEEALVCGATYQEACVYAGIHPSSLYRHLEKNPEFRERINGLKGMLTLRAKMVIFESLKAGCLETSWKVLERGRVEGYQ